MAEKIEFSTTTVLQTDAWANYVLAVIIPIEQRRSFNSMGGDIVKVTIEPVKKDKEMVYPSSDFSEGPSTPYDLSPLESGP